LKYQILNKQTNEQNYWTKNHLVFRCAKFCQRMCLNFSACRQISRLILTYCDLSPEVVTPLSAWSPSPVWETSPFLAWISLNNQKRTKKIYYNAYISVIDKFQQNYAKRRDTNWRKKRLWRSRSFQDCWKIWRMNVITYMGRKLTKYYLK